MPVDVTKDFIHVQIRDFAYDKCRITSFDGKLPMGVRSKYCKVQNSDDWKTRAFIFRRADGWTKAKAVKWANDHKRMQKSVDSYSDVDLIIHAAEGCSMCIDRLKEKGFEIPDVVPVDQLLVTFPVTFSSVLEPNSYIYLKRSWKPKTPKYGRQIESRYDLFIRGDDDEARCFTIGGGSTLFEGDVAVEVDTVDPWYNKETLGIKDDGNISNTPTHVTRLKQDDATVMMGETVVQIEMSDCTVTLTKKGNDSSFWKVRRD